MRRYPGQTPAGTVTGMEDRRPAGPRPDRRGTGLPGWVSRPVALPVKLLIAAMLLVPLAGVVSGVAGVRLLHSYLSAQADRQLRAYALSLLGGSFVTQPVFGGPHPGSQLGTGISVEIVDPTGRRLVRSGEGTGPYNGVPVGVAWISSHVGR